MFLISLLQQIRMPQDGGMLYAETDVTQLFPEPLNAISSLLFLALAAYWLYRLRGNYVNYSFLTFCVLLLLVGAIGGSVYHGLRLWRPFIMMDWLPIMLLCVFTAIHFLVRVSNWLVSVLVTAAYFGFAYWMRSGVRPGSDLQFWINLNYVVMAFLVILPVLWFLVKSSFRFGSYVLLALVSFGFAIFFRIADGFGWLSTGTHFLWHTFGAIATACMLLFLYRVRSAEITSY